MTTKKTIFRNLIGLFIVFIGNLIPVKGQTQLDRSAITADSLFIREHYKKVEQLIPMRDGTQLFTALYIPLDSSKTYPIMLDRTPYGIAPYGPDVYKTSIGPSMTFAKEGFIFVYQDIRGKGMSEGNFVAVRPYIPHKKSKKDIDESSDTYDTIDWLLKHVKGNNGKVGTWGISAPGFYTTVTAIEAHPALVAVSPQAPVTDWFMGDDRHHNGAFFFMGSFAFLSSFGMPRPIPAPKAAPAFRDYGTPDGYDFYLKVGPLKNIDEKIFHGQNFLWNEMMEHGTYDNYWKSMTPVPHLRNIKPAMLVTGGWFDQEDLYGPLKVYEGLREQSPNTKTTLVMGPWIHGGWARADGESLGDIRFNTKTSPFYRDHIEFPFFMHYLKDTEDPQLPGAYVFETGSNQWKQYNQWPPKESTAQSLYLLKGKQLAFTAPTKEGEPFDEYLSDPEKPVPFTNEIRTIRGSDFMYEDQRFAAKRPDVLVYETPVLTEDVTVAGNVQADLFISSTGTDADFVVKLIDVYPDDAPDNSPRPNTKMGGFQLLVRGEVMRAKFRKSFADPSPLTPGKVEEVKFDMQDANHTFLKGHKMMVQIQSSWFPLVDRNPQKFVDIYHASEEDFQKATQRIYHTNQYPSHLVLPILKK